jgi:predicted peptidase
MPQTTRDIEKQITLQLKLKYLEYLPPDYSSDPAKKWPLIIFLHGAGERGDDLSLVKIHGIPKIIETRDLPFVALSPQCPTGHWWSDYLPLLDDMIQSALDRLNVDPDRVYLTGLSMGGFGTWHLAVEYPHRFAAIAPICGGSPWMYDVHRRLNRIRHIPTWVFHGDKDEIVYPAESDVMVRLLKEVGGDVKYTLYTGVGHDSWTATYEGSTLFDWFLSQKRRSA